MKIGFIGLGIMGSRMAANLQSTATHWSCSIALAPKRSRYSVLRNISQIPQQNSPNKWMSCLRCWLIPTQSNKRLWARMDFWITSANALWVDCSSVNPSFSKKMAAEAARREVHFVDAPVTGSAPRRGSEACFLGGS
jgi:3-hydroxyisobutyrate dehydrogenase-like beta-hydroxyacid dehydrogenase